MSINFPAGSVGFGPDGPDLPHLLDERSEPNFREVFATLSRRSYRIDAAVAAIRLTGLDLTRRELRSVERIRLLMARIDALALRGEAEALLADPGRARTLRHLVHRLQSGGLEIRSSPLAGWTPDFTVFHRSGRALALVVGLHWFARPYPHRGPALASIHGPTGAALAAGRFEENWTRAHDVGPAVLNLLRSADERGPSARFAGPAIPSATTRPVVTPANPRKGPQEKGKPAIDQGGDVLDTPSPSG